MADERLLDFPSKPAPVPADIIYCGDSADAFNEVQITIEELISAYPGLLSIGELTTVADRMIYTTGADTYAVTPITAFGRSMLDDANAGAVLTTLGISAFMQTVLPAADAATAAATLAVLPLAGGTMAGAIDMGTFGVTNAANPVNPQDLATKLYVDNAVSSVHAPCVASTTANLAGYTYSNGASGVGATLTAGSNGAFSTDGVSPSVNARILVPFQSTTYENGIYTLTTVGDGSNPAVLTRATDYDQPADIQPGDKVIILQGTLYGGTEWVETATVATIGTDPILFSLISLSAYLLKSANLSDVANAATAFGNIKQAATTSATGVIQMADQAAQEAGTTGRAVTSDVQQFHPSASKTWIKFGTVTTTTIALSYNVSSLTDHGTGDTTVNFSVTYGNANYCYTVGCNNSAGFAVNVEQNAGAAVPATTSCRFIAYRVTTDAAVDVQGQEISFFGDLA